MQDLIQSLIGWLPDAVEPYAEVLVYLGCSDCCRSCL